MQPWRNWFHCTGSMYGQWLPGEDRGWRERDHRRHVDADYKHPFPKRAFADLKARSKKLLKQSPVELNHDQRIEVCKSLHAALIEREVEVVEMSIGAKHWHLLARFTAPNKLSPRDPKIIVGEAKGKCSFILSRQGIVKPGGIWAAGCRTLSINDEGHFWNCKKYVHDHLFEGAAVLSELIKLAEPRP